LKNKVFSRTVSKGEKSYAYAKACGIIGKSFVGSRIKNLETVTRLSELDKLVFPKTFKDLPEKELLTDLEDRIINRAVDSIISIIKCFSRPPEFLILLLRSYEYADLKSVIYSLNKGSDAPPHTNIAPYQTINFKAWPDFPRQLILKPGRIFMPW